MKQKKRLLALTLCGCLLAGCGAEPAEITEASESPRVTEAAEVPEITEPQGKSETFQSLDGSAEFILDIAALPEIQAMPIVEIRPHFVTGEDLQRAGKVLLGDVDFYEREPQIGAKYSKSEIQKAIDTMEPLMNREAMAAAFGEDTNMVDMLPTYGQLLENLKKKLAEGTEDNPHTLCKWEFHNWNHYNNWDQEPDPGFDVIFATAEKDGHEYLLTAARDQGEDLLSTITCTMTTNLLEYQLGRALYSRELCSEKPTEDQVENILFQAQKTLDDLGLGKWGIDDWEISRDTHTGDPRYTVEVHTAPVVEGIQTLSRFSFSEDPMDWVRDAYCWLSYAPGGELMGFDLAFPIEESRVIGEKQTLLPVSELMGHAKDYLQSLHAEDGIGVWDKDIDRILQQTGETLRSQTRIHTAKLALGRYQTGEGDFQYVPVFILRGHTEYLGRDSGKVWLTSADSGTEHNQLVVLNALDGTVIG